MKAVSSVLIIVLVLFSFALGVTLVRTIFASDIKQFFTSSPQGCGRYGQLCCSGNLCDAGLICYENTCIEESTLNEIRIDEEYLIYNMAETGSMTDTVNYLYSRVGLGWQDCPNANNCQNCSKVSNIRNPVNCLDCDRCNLTASTCNNCLSCESASDNTPNPRKYEGLNDCFNCTSCINIDSDMADSCSQCEYCNMYDNVTYDNGLNCNNCYQCDSNTGKCYSCYDCDMPQEKVCEVCDKPSNDIRNQCKIRQDYDLCKKIKECIANYEGEPCEIEEFLPISWNNSFNLRSTFSNILSNCNVEDLKRTLPEGIKQKMCRYDNLPPVINDFSWIDFLTPRFLKPYFVGDDTAYVPPASLELMLTSDNYFNGVTGENKGILFSSCGYNIMKNNVHKPNFQNTIFSSDPEIFTPIVKSTVPKVGSNIPVNLKVILSNISWNEQSTNNCNYDIYLCPQEAIAEASDDPILDFYRLFAYFNETQYPRRPTVRWTQGRVNVLGIEYTQKFVVDLKGKEVDVSHAAKAIVAGIRDYFFVNSISNQTNKFFCLNSELYSEFELCYNQSASVVLNDNMPWKLSAGIPADFLATIPNYKYIYYNATYPIFNATYPTVEVKVSFFMYVTDIPEINNTVFVTPVISIIPHEIPYCPDKCEGGKEYRNGGGRPCVYPPANIKTCVYGCKPDNVNCYTGLWCPEYGGWRNHDGVCGDSPGDIHTCDGSECFITERCIREDTGKSGGPALPTCQWTDLWWICWCTYYPCCCSETKTCTLDTGTCAANLAKCPTYS